MASGKPQQPGPAYGWLNLQPAMPPEVPVASLEMDRRKRIQDLAPTSDAVLARARQALDIERRREAPGSLTQPDPYDGDTGLAVDWRARNFSASQLIALGQCGFRWWARYELGLQAPDEAIDDVRPQVRGLLYHRALELAAKAASNQPDLRQAMLDALETVFHQAERDLARDHLIHLDQMETWAAQRREHLTVLRQAILHPTFLEDGTRIEGTETEFMGLWREFTLRGVVDRIDRVQDELVILDYKAGASNYGKVQDARRRNTLDLQLPIYQETAGPALFPGETIRAASYLYLAKPAREAARVDGPALDALAVRLQTMLETGSFRVAPDIQRKACMYCDLRPVCRAGNRLGRKEP